ncbi:MAG: 3-deoxy-8-phosphooctulonate synthase [Pseudomonadota bacterium]
MNKIPQRSVAIGTATFSNELPFALISGPCQAESSDHAVDIAGEMASFCKERSIGYVFKASFDKANRTSISGKRGLGLEQGLAALDAVKTQIGCPVITDVHLPDQCAPVAAVCDALQIPAYLCRQTDLLLAAGETGKPVNVKKGQFLAPWDMPNVAEKLASSGNDEILLCERGTSFGYNTLVADMRGLPQMAATGYPVIFDATHSVQQPGGRGGSSGGQREFAPVLARAAAATGVAGFFIETHRTPDTAPSDGPNMIPLDQMAGLLDVLQSIDRPAKQWPIRLG